MPKAPKQDVKVKDKRLPSVKATDEVLKAKETIEQFYQPRMGFSYSFAHIMRRLILLEAQHINEHGKSILTED